MATKKESLDFEATVARLDTIASGLEKENVSLEEALKLYEEGVRLVRTANEVLENAERRIHILKMSADGELTEENFAAAPTQQGDV